LFGEFPCFNDDLFVTQLGGYFFWHNFLPAPPEELQ
jgi:hypothetical protein